MSKVRWIITGHHPEKIYQEQYLRMCLNRFLSIPRPMPDHKKELETTKIYQLFFFRCNQAGWILSLCKNIKENVLTNIKKVFYNTYKKSMYCGCLCSFEKVAEMAISQNQELLEQQQQMNN